MAFDTSAHPRSANGEFTEKTGAPAEVSLTVSREYKPVEGGGSYHFEKRSDGWHWVWEDGAGEYAGTDSSPAYKTQLEAIAAAAQDWEENGSSLDQRFSGMLRGLAKRGLPVRTVTNEAEAAESEKSPHLGVTQYRPIENGGGYHFEESENGWRWVWTEPDNSDEDTQFSPYYKSKAGALRAAAQDWDENGSSPDRRFSGMLRGLATRV